MDAEDIRQPTTVSQPINNYLDMATSRSRPPERMPRARRERERMTRPTFDNEGLSLEEGNDFA